MAAAAVPARLSAQSLAGQADIAGSLALSRMPFFLSVSDAAAVPDRVPGIATASELPRPQGRDSAGRLTVDPSRAPVQDGTERNSIAFVTFAAAVA